MTSEARSARVEALATMADNTAGAASLDDCRAAGMTDDQVYWLVESGRWQTPFSRTFVVFTGPIPLLTSQHAALHYAGEGAAVSHESAAHYWRLPDRRTTSTSRCPIGARSIPNRGWS